MNLHDKLLNLIYDENLTEYKSLLQDNNLIFNDKIETNLLIECINKDKYIYFDEFIKHKTNTIYYFNFEEILSIIIKKNKLNYCKSIFIIKNINLYINFKTIVKLSIENNNYNILEYIINNNLFNLHYYSYISIIKLIIDIEDNNIIKLLIDKITIDKHKFEIDNNDELSINQLLNCDRN